MLYVVFVFFVRHITEKEIGMIDLSAYVCSSGFRLLCKQKTAYEMRISDWSSYVCSSDLPDRTPRPLDPGRDASTGAACAGSSWHASRRTHPRSAVDTAARNPDRPDPSDRSRPSRAPVGRACGRRAAAPE